MNFARKLLDCMPLLGIANVTQVLLSLQGRKLVEQMMEFRWAGGRLESEMTEDNTSYVDKFDPAIKKKKKKKPLDCDDGSSDYLIQKSQNLASERDEQEFTRNGHLPGRNFERDYRYKELLSRLFDMLRGNNPEISGERQRTVMMPPQLLEGTQRTVCLNFIDLCRTMHRKPDNVMGFLVAEMGTRGSLDGQQRLVLKTRVSPKDFEGIFRRYIDMYVICSCCKSPNTTLVGENHLFFLRCEMCGSRRSVTAIKDGFHCE